MLFQVTIYHFYVNIWFYPSKVQDSHKIIYEEKPQDDSSLEQWTEAQLSEHYFPSWK